MAELLEASSDAVMAIDGDNRIIGWNDACERLLGTRPSTAMGAHCYDAVGGLDVFGNPFCGSQCAVIRMRQRGSTANPFVLTLPSGRALRCSTSIFRGSSAPYPITLHVLTPVEASSDILVNSNQLLDRWIQPDAPQHLVRAAPVGPPQVPAENPLTARETEVLQLVAKGVGTRETAEVLGIRWSTVRNHVANILRKLEVSSRLAAVAYARELDIIE